jgi:hypothetical protein
MPRFTTGIDTGGETTAGLGTGAGAGAGVGAGASAEAVVVEVDGVAEGAAEIVTPPSAVSLAAAAGALSFLAGGFLSLLGLLGFSAPSTVGRG